jgi:hypothetical protein
MELAVRATATPFVEIGQTERVALNMGTVAMTPLTAVLVAKVDVALVGDHLHLPLPALMEVLLLHPPPALMGSRLHHLTLPALLEVHLLQLPLLFLLGE